MKIIRHPSWYMLAVSALLFLVPTQLGYHFWPEWAFVLGRRIDYLSPTLYLTDFIIGAIILMNISGIARVSRRFVRHWVTWFVLAAVTVNIIFSVRPLVSAYFVLRILEYFLLGMSLYSSSITLPWTYFIWGATFNALLGLAQVVHGGSVGGIFRLFGERTFSVDSIGIALQTLSIPGTWYGRELLRAYGTTPHPNVLGATLAVALIMTIVAWRRKSIIPRRAETRIRYFAGLGILGAGLLATGSRSAILAFGTGAAVLLIYPHINSVLLRIRKRMLPEKKDAGIFRSTAVIPFLLTTVLIIWPLAEILTDITENSQSVAERKVQIDTAAKVLAAHPFTGSGLGTFIISMSRISRERHGSVLQPVHNVPLLFAAEAGILGVTVLCLIFFRFGPIVPLTHPLTMLLLLFLISDHYLYTLQTGRILSVIMLAELTKCSRNHTRK